MPQPSLLSRSIWLGLISYGLSLTFSTSSLGQETAQDKNALARYVPQENLIFYFEYQGLDAHAEAWKKSAAYKILNDTPTGAMLEDLAAQLFSKLTATPGQVAPSGPENVTLIKHLARNGFLWAMVTNPQDPSKLSQILVFRNAFKDKSIRGLFARGFQSMNAPNTKPLQVVRLGHKIVTGVQKSGEKFAWWVEDSKKEDIVLVLPTTEATDVFLETLDGKRPNVTKLDRRSELLQSENGFTPNGIFFLDNLIFEKLGKTAAGKVVKGISSLDLRWGFQNDALMSITKIGTASPRTGFLAIFDGPGVDKAKLPPMPDGITEFTAVSLDLKQAADQAIGLARSMKPDLEKQINGFLDSVKNSTKLRLQEDILAHLGPKVSIYTLPTKSGGKAAAGPSGMLGAMMTTMGAAQVPRTALVFEIENPAAFGKVLDQVMVGVNKELKSRAAKEVGGDAPALKSGRGRAASVPSLEFRSIPGETKTYVMNVPADLSSQYPASFRPAIRVGAKYAVLAVTAEVAKAVMDTKESWTPPAELVASLQALPSSLKVLNVSDPRDTFPAILASLPGNLQKSINSALQLRTKSLSPGTTDASAPPNQPGAPNAGGAGKLNKFKSMTPDGPNRDAPPGAPGPGTTPAATAPTGSVILQVDSSKLPSADAIKALLFPSVFAIEAKDQEIRFITRGAFPTFPDLSKLLGLVQLGMMSGASGPAAAPSGTNAPFQPGIQSDSSKPRGGGSSPGAREN